MPQRTTSSGRACSNGCVSSARNCTRASFIPLFDQKAPDGTRSHTLKKYESRLKYLNDHLTGREFLLDRFSVADAYLYTVLNWTVPTRVDLAPWPAIKSYHEYLQTRPSIAKAFLEELALYKAELTRHKAA